MSYYNILKYLVFSPSVRKFGPLSSVADSDHFYANPNPDRRVDADLNPEDAWNKQKFNLKSIVVTVHYKMEDERI